MHNIYLSLFKFKSQNNPKHTFNAAVESSSICLWLFYCTRHSLYGLKHLFILCATRSSNFLAVICLSLSASPPPIHRPPFDPQLILQHLYSFIPIINSSFVSELPFFYIYFILFFLLRIRHIIYLFYIKYQYLV